MQPMSMNSAHGHHPGMKYHEHQGGGQQGDTLSDFVSLVCQENNIPSQGQVGAVCNNL